MRIEKESDLLVPAKLKELIAEIEGNENKQRKAEAYKRYQCYKDKTSHYVCELLMKQFDTSTVEEMQYAISNVSIVKKVVDKLARVYSHGITREISGKDTETEKLKKLEKALDINTVLKKVNRFAKLQKNVDLFIKPCPVVDAEGGVKYKIKLEALLPFLYDVVEDKHDREKAIAVILSDYVPTQTSLAQFNQGVSAPAASTAPVAGDGKDQLIADKPSDQQSAEKKTYILWSKNYHFTFDSEGNITHNADNTENKNPFGVFNHITYSLDQDGSFWAEGGNDLIDGAVLLNALITHTTHVGVVQGYGQFYMTGENLPRSIKIGPSKAIIAEYKKEDQAEPKMGFLNANPQLDSLRGLIEMYVALLLTTNNLSTSGVSTQLQGGSSLASGVALIIDKAESLEDVQDQRSLFADREVELFQAVNAILEAYGDDVTEEFKGLQLEAGFEKEFTARFHDAQAIQTESEKLTNLKLRKELGLETAISLLMKDDPTLDEKKAEERLKKIIEQRLLEKMLEQQNGLNGQEDETKPEVDGEDPAAQPKEDVAAGGVGQTTEADDVQKLALNGAQVTALVEIVEKVAAGTLPRESAVNMIVTAFNTTPEDANKILGSAGNGFKIEKPEPVAPKFIEPELKETEEA